MTATSKLIWLISFTSYTATNDSNFQADLAQGLSFLKTDEGLKKVLSVLKDKDVVKPQDLSAWYATFLRRSFAQEAMWNWAREDWDWIKQALGGDMSFDSFVNIPAQIFKTQQRLDEYKAFFEPQLTDMALSRNISIGIKSIAARLDLIQKDKKSVEKAIIDCYVRLGILVKTNTATTLCKKIKLSLMLQPLRRLSCFAVCRLRLSILVKGGRDGK